MTQINFFTSEETPPWLPTTAREARSHAFWAQIVALIEIPAAVVLAIISFYYYFKYSAPGYVLVNPNAASYSTSYLWFAVYLIAVVFVCILEVAFIKLHVTSFIDTGHFSSAEERAIIWGIISILFGILPGIFLIASAVKLRATGVQMPQSAVEHQEQPLSHTTAQQKESQPPAKARQPESQVKSQPFTVPPATGPSRQHADMVKCKKCGASFPAFMHSCPNCNEPKS
ncbi:MAG: hypothetical protein KIY12_08240 [Thermoplasmata archaeon]|uniref:Uncharacterized protein n=1 Tax=Candidatus Sysuiplasma superficiale TaxID=2823368 RepID=A0A8J8CI73_9ARCH|nr:hypothetical protein [Candidatus Sysuiplasma superficiale]